MVNKSFPKADIPAEKVTAESKAAWWKEHWELNRGGKAHGPTVYMTLLTDFQSCTGSSSIEWSWTKRTELKTIVLSRPRPAVPSPLRTIGKSRAILWLGLHD